MDNLGVFIRVFMVIIFTSNISIATSTSGFPFGCKDTSNTTFIDCSHMGLTEVPTMDGQVISVDLSWNKLEKIESLNFPNLRFLNISNNAISHIHIFAFDKLVDLKMLDLSFNLISGENITRETFTGLKSLEQLYLQGNPLRIVQEGALHFLEVESLEFVDMKFCRIARIEKNAMSDISSLETLYLNGNELMESDLNLLEGLSFLETLDISDNPLRRIPDKPFFHMVLLTQLHIESCQIRVLGEDAFDGLYHLTYLSLNNNSLEVLDVKTFLPLVDLEELVLSRNPIKVIDSSTFGGFANNILRILKLEFMPELETIEKNSFLSLDKLRFLYVTNNRKLTKLEGNALLSHWSLQIVNLDNNSLINIPKDLLNWDDIQWVSLYGNPWYCDCKLSWIVSPAGPKNKTTPMTCQGPAEHRGLNLLNIPPSDLGCVNRATKIALGVLLIAGLLLLLSLSVWFIIRWRKKDRYTLKDICCFVCSRGQGERYISVYQNDDVEPFASITFSEEEKSKSAEHV